MDATDEDIERLGVKVTACRGCTALHSHTKDKSNKRKPWELLSVIPIWKR